MLVLKGNNYHRLSRIVCSSTRQLFRASKEDVYWMHMKKKKLVHLNEDVARNRTEKQDNNTLVLHWYVTSNLPGYQEATRNIFIARIVI